MDTDDPPPPPIDPDPDELFELWHRLLRYALRVLGHRQDAEDATSDTFQVLYEWLAGRRRGPADAARWKRWLWGTHKNKCRDVLRRRERDGRGRGGDDRGAPRPAVDPPAEEVVARGEVERGRLEAVRRCIEEALDPRGRSMVLLRAAGTPYGEIASIWGVERGNVYVIVHRAIQRIRRCLEAQGGTQEHGDG